jgi:hypothetical protein
VTVERNCDVVVVIGEKQYLGRANRLPITSALPVSCPAAGSVRSLAMPHFAAVVEGEVSPHGGALGDR